MAVKRDGGRDYAASDYLVVPDAEQPATWKLRIREYVDDAKKVTTAQLGRAASALGPGFRGRRVQLAAGQRGTAVAKLREMYKTAGVEAADLPSVLQAADYRATSARMRRTAKKMAEAATDALALGPLALSIREDSALLETYYGGGITATTDGALSFETICAAIAVALKLWHSGAHATELYCTPDVIATFPEAVVYKHEDKLYQVGYRLEGTNAVLDDDAVEVTAEFSPVSGEGTTQEAKKPATVEKTTQESAEVAIAEARPSGRLQDATIDRDERVIRDTVLITKHSTNGPAGKREYSDAALQSIASMAEGLPAYANHVPADQAWKPRDVKDLIGRHRNVRYDAARGRITSDLHILEHQAPWIFALADDMADVVGNSLVSRGYVRRDGDREVVEDISAVRSGDLVSDPATTRGLFEHREAWISSHPATEKGGTTDMETPKDLNVQTILEHVRRDTAHGAAVKDALAGPELKSLTEAKATLEAEVVKLKAELTEAKTATTALKAKVDAYEAADASRAKAAKLDTVLAESDLGKRFGKHPFAVTAEFKALLLESADEAKWTAMIADRVKILDEAAKTTPNLPRVGGKDETVTEGKDTALPANAHARAIAALVG